MRTIRTVLLTSLVLGCAPAFAADPITIETSTNQALPIQESDPFDWTGFYAGLYGTVHGGAAATQYGVGLSAGVNAQFDFYLVGAEVSVSGITDGAVGETASGQILGRAGLVVADGVLVYGAGGYGIDLGPPNADEAVLGGGLEFAVTNDVSVRAQYLHGFPTVGGNPSNQFSLGANFHF